MSHDMNHDRRRFLGAAVMTLAASRLGRIGSANAPSGDTAPAYPVSKSGTTPLLP
jgi:nitrous oxide reductase